MIRSSSNKKHFLASKESVAANAAATATKAGRTIEELQLEAGLSGSGGGKKDESGDKESHTTNYSTRVKYIKKSGGGGSEENFESEDDDEEDDLEQTLNSLELEEKRQEAAGMEAEEDNSFRMEKDSIMLLDYLEEAVSYTHLTLPTIYSV